MTSLLLSRRAMVATAAAALVPLRESVAQTAAAKGDWLAMVKAHHALVAKTFDTLLASERKTHLQREMMVHTLGYQLTAHSVAEENVLYPALARAGMLTESDKLYLDQAHAKVMNAQAELAAAGKDPAALMTATRALQAAVLKHARDDEEGRIYPALKAKIDTAQNAMLTAAYQREFASVKPSRALQPI